MKIKSIKINSFGKLNDKDIDFSDNINIVYGKNEAGKSTILKFIASMFYGINKTKNGKEISDFDQYEPWTKNEFSGKIKYELDNKKSFEVFRDFKKKNPIIYDEASEDITKDFSIDKTKGSEFFKEQTGVDEELFYSTIVSEQEKVKLDEKEQTTLLQKITNLASTGSDSISYKKAESKLKTKLIDEVGTDRTLEKPKNKVENKLNELTAEYKRLENASKEQFDFDEKERQISKKIESNQDYINAYKEIVKEKEADSFEEKLIKNYEEEIERLEKSIKEKKGKEPENNISKNKNGKKGIFSLISLAVLIILTIILFIFNPVKVINYIVLGLAILNLILVLFNIFVKTQVKNKINEENIKNKKEIEILESNLENKIKEIENQKAKLYEKQESSKNLVKNKYPNAPVNIMFSKSLENAKFELEKEEDANNELKLNLKELQIERKNAVSGIEKMPELEEQIAALSEEKEELSHLEKSIMLAKNTLEESYDEMKKSLTPKFTKELSLISSKISGGKYNNVKFNDEEGLLIELENGEYKKTERLSTGTIFQMYLSLRLSMAEEISEEKMPIILDESFAYYDDERLENVLEYLSKEYPDRQVIIFTCSKRESKILEKNKIEYKYIEI